MKTMLVAEADYNGLGWSNKRKITPREVELLGVPSPVDPGVVMIKDGEKERKVATSHVKPCPRFDWEAMLSKKQLDVREQTGMLFGTGVPGETTLLPLEQCVME